MKKTEVINQLKSPGLWIKHEKINCIHSGKY